MSDDGNSSIASQAEESPTPTMSEPSKENAEQTLTPHSVYYFDPVVFRVEGVLFKVPKYGFMVPGSMFYDMVSLPIPEGEEAEGSDSNPINPPSVTQQEFFGFLFVMYPFLGRAAHHEINYEELVGALRLATMWQFPKIRSSAMHLISPLLTSRHPVENVLLARQYGWRSLLRQGYITLIKKHITVEDLRHPHELDWETISRIFAAKTQLLEGDQSSVQCPACAMPFTLPCSLKCGETHTIELGAATAPNAAIEDRIDLMFQEDLQKMEHDSEVDVDYIEREFKPYLSRPINGEQVTQQTEGSAETLQDTQTLSNSEVDQTHHVYYIETLLIPVESTLFRLPKADLLPISDHIPPGISARSFHWFLSAFYSIGECELLDYDQWLDVLHLSTLWGFTEIRQKAITKLSPLMKDRNLVETVLTARKYQVKPWMLCALEGLANRIPGSNMVQELREPFELDWETIAKLLSIQCQSQPRRPNASCNNCNFLKTAMKKKVTCSHTCNKLNLPVDEQAYQNYYQSRDSGWRWSLNLESSEDLTECDSKDTIRAMVRREFREETMTWP